MSNSRMQHRLPHKGLRTALAVVLSLSMVLGGVPVPAVQAIADELDGQTTPIEEPTGEPAEGEGAAGDQNPQGNAQDPQEGAPGDGQGEGEGDEQDGEGQSADGEGNEQSADGEGDEQPADGDDNGNEKPADGEGKKDEGRDRPILGVVRPGNQLDPTKLVTTVDNKDYGIQLNLFDYETTDNESNHYGSPDTASGINAGKTSADETTKLFFYAKGDLPNDHSLNAPNINLFAGFGSWSATASQNGFALQYALQGIVKRDLSDPTNTDYSQRFPVVNTSSNESLAYLFDPAVTTYDPNAKKSYTNVNHFFEDKDGYLYFSSNEHYAYYDRSQGNNGDFTIYEDTYGRYSGGGNNLAIGYFPFDEFNGGANGRGPSVPGACINPTTHPQWSNNNHVNHTMGMSMTVPITMPYDGQVEYIKPDGTTELKDMIFEFSGDDDMWVFIDGRLVLDIGGIHQPVKGTINFHTGQVEIASGTTADTGGVDPRNQASGQYNNQYSYVTGNFTMRAAGISDTNVLGTNSSIWKDTKQGNQAVAFPDDNRWPADTQHVVQFFYLERGGCDSNLEIMTNIHLRNEKSAMVEKLWDKALYDPENGIDKRKPVDVQLIRQAVMREENSSTHEHTVIGYTMFDHEGKVKTWNGTEWVVDQVDTDNDGTPDKDVTTPDNPIKLSNENHDTKQWWGWKYTWENLPSGGYNTNGWIDGLEEENEDPNLTYDDDGNVIDVHNNVYCDYNYYVREVPNDDYEFVPRYTQANPDGSTSTLYPEDLTYLVPGANSKDGMFVPAANPLYPVRITNEPVTIDVEKKWRNAAGNADDPVNHNAATNDDSVWVQLYCEERVNMAEPGEPEDWVWTAAQPVGDTAVKLSKANEWKTTFDASPSQNRRYYVLEGSANDDGTSFTPFIALDAAKVVDDAESGAPYVIDETWYTRDGARSGGATGVTATTQEVSETYKYFWEKQGTPNTENYTVVRTFGGDAELIQRGEQERTYKSDTISLQLEVPASTADGYHYKATVDLDSLQIDGGVGKIKAPDGVTPVPTEDGFEVQFDVAGGSAARTITLTIPIKGDALSSYVRDGAANVTVTHTECLPAASAENSTNVNETIYGHYLQLSDTFTHGTAKVANKPIKLLKLRKVDAKAYAEAVKKANDYNAEHPDETPAKTYEDYLVDKDWLKGAEFKLFADNLNGTTSTDPVKFDENVDAVDTLRIPDAETTFTTGDDGTVKLTSLTDKGTYWLVEVTAPTGYINRGMERPIRIDVDENGVLRIVSQEEAATKPVVKSAKGVDIITVPNVRTYMLPAAGGPGAYPFLIAGAFVAAYALGGFGARGHRSTRRRGARRI